MSKSFNPKLYKDSLRQLKMQGIVLLILSMMTTAIPIIIQLIEIRQYQYEELMHYAPHTGMHLSLMAFMFAGSYILTYCAFRYLNKRSASDIYDSLPNTRACTFVSLACAVLTWIGVIVFANIALQFSLSYLFNGGHMAVGGTLKYFVFYLLSSAVVAASTMFGMSLTGTAFTNFVASGLTLCLPRAVITLFEVMAVLAGQIVTLKSMPGVFSPANNFVIAMPFSWLFNYDFDYVLDRWQGYVYTFVLFALVFVLALYSFVKRKSETAGKPSVGKITQVFFRCSLSFPFLAMFFGVLVSSIYDEYYTDISYCVILMTIAIAVFFLYEILTSKSLKSMFRSIPSFLVIVVVSALITYLGVLCGNQLRKQVPSADKIEYVQIKSSAGSFSMKRDETYDYYSKMTSEIDFSDSDTIDCVLEILSQNSDRHTYNNLSYRDSRDFIIKLKDGSTMVREVKITENMNKKLQKCKENNEEYKKIYSKVPAASTVSGIFVNYKNLNFEFDNIEEFMNVFAEDAAENGIETCIYSSGLTVALSGNESGKPYYIIYDVAKRNPKIVRYIQNYLMGDAAAETVSAAKKKYEDGSLLEVSIRLSEYDYTESSDLGDMNATDILYFNSDTSKENYDKMFEIVENSITNTNLNYNAVMFDYTDGTQSDEVKNNMIFISDEDLETLVGISADVSYDEDGTDEPYEVLYDDEISEDSSEYEVLQSDYSAESSTSDNDSREASDSDDEVSENSLDSSYEVDTEENENR